MPGPKHILIIRFSSIGDIVLTTPVVRCIRNTYGENCVIHYATKKAFAGWLEQNTYIDHVHVLNEGESVFSFVKKIKRDFRIHAIADLHHNLRSLIIKWHFPFVPKASFPKMNIRKWLYVRFKWNTMPDVHVVERYFKAVEFLGVQYDGKGLDFFVSAQDEARAAELVQAETGYSVVTVGAKFATKALPEDKMTELVRNIPGKIILLGGKEDTEKARHIYENCPGKDITDLCGKCSLGISAAVVKNATHVYAHDTGLMHIAAAFNRPITLFWGNTTPRLGMGPFLAQNAPLKPAFREVQGLSCRPCSKIGYAECPLGHFKCMREQDTTVQT